jgi:hypothetical protein
MGAWALWALALAMQVGHSFLAAALISHLCQVAVKNSGPISTSASKRVLPCAMKSLDPSKCWAYKVLQKDLAYSEVIPSVMGARKIVHAVTSLLILLCCSRADAQAKLHDVQGKIMWPGMQPEAAHSNMTTEKNCVKDFRNDVLTQGMSFQQQI